MKKLLGGGLAFGFAAMGTFGLAGPTSAGQAPLKATIDRTTAEEGSTVYFTSVDACLQGENDPGSVVFELYYGAEADPVYEFEEDITPEENPEGQWTIGLELPVGVPLGTYTADISCWEDGEEGAYINSYNELSFTVTALDPEEPGPDPEPEPEPEPEPAPAPPVRRQPRVTG